MTGVTDEDRMCAVAWSPQGVDYGAAGGRPVSIVLMYLVPAEIGTKGLLSLAGSSPPRFSKLWSRSASSMHSERRAYLL